MKEDNEPRISRRRRRRRQQNTQLIFGVLYHSDDMVRKECCRCENVGDCHGVYEVRSSADVRVTKTTHTT